MGGLFIALGLLLFGGGIGAIVYGWPYLVLEYGFTIVIAGAVATNGGLILIGIGLVLRAIRRLGDRIERKIAENPQPVKEAEAPDATAAANAAIPPAATFPAEGGPVMDGVSATSASTTVEGSEATASEPGPVPADSGPHAASHATHSHAFPGATAEEPEPEPNHPAGTDEGIVRTYTVGDASFTMYANGTVKAQTPEGVETFANVDELRTYLATRMNTSTPL